jgi:hypothetical protein
VSSARLGRDKANTPKNSTADNLLSKVTAYAQRHASGERCFERVVLEAFVVLSIYLNDYIYIRFQDSA